MKIFKGKKGLDDKIHAYLDKVLYIIPGTKTAILNRDAIEGILVTGQTGSGKSSGPLRHIIKAMLKAGYGFVVLCVKPEERALWEAYAAEVGRTGDLVVFNEDSPYQFNPLAYELQRSDKGAGESLNLINMLMSLHEQMQIHQGGSKGGNDEKFWDQALRRLIKLLTQLLKLAEEPLSIANMEQLVVDSFDNYDLEAYQKMQQDLRDASIGEAQRENIYAQYKHWVEENYFLYVFEKASQKVDLNGSEQRMIRRVQNYWFKQWPMLSEKTRSIVEETFMGLIDPFSDGILESHFSEGVSPELFPERTYQESKIIIIDFPVKTYGLSGIYASTLYKTAFQACIERRQVEKEENPTAVSLFIDEYQNLVSPLTDSFFQLTARSAWVSCVYGTQNINNLMFVMGSSMPEARAKSLLGNLNLKIFCANSDYLTNEWAAKMIGQHFIDKSSISLNAKKEKSQTLDQILHYHVPPEHFTMLKTGSPVNKLIVETIIFKAGKQWSKDKGNFIEVQFNQISI